MGWFKRKKEEDVGRPYHPLSLYVQALGFAEAGRIEDARRALQDAVECGWIDVDGIRASFTGLLGGPTVDALISRAGQIANELMVVHVPANVGQSAPVPLLIAFHADGENAQGYVRSWKTVCDRLGLVVAAFQGLKREEKDRERLSFEWPQFSLSELEIQQVRERLSEAVELAKQRAKIDATRLILVGCQSGGLVALRLLQQTSDAFCGAVLENPWVLSERGNGVGGSPKARIYILKHKGDGGRASGKQMAKALEGQGFDVRLKLVADSDDSFDDSSRVEALRFVLGLDAGRS